MRKPYPTDLSDAQWNYIEPHMPAPKGHGRPTIHTLREILNALFTTVSKEWLPVVVASACSRVPYGEMAHRLSLRQRLGTEKALGWSVENWSKESAQSRPRRSALMRWAEELAKEGKMVEVGTSICHRGHFRSSHAAGWWNAPLPADWPQQEDEPSDYEKFCTSGEAFVYAAMSRLMLRQSART